MPEIVFIDTSVILNLCDVPGKNSDRATVSDEFLALAEERGSVLILPVAALVEAGNHIEHISNGHHRRECASILDGLIRSSVDGTPPWVVSDAQWGADFLKLIVDGVPPAVPGMVDAAIRGQGIGLGDLSIVIEAGLYRGRVDVPTGVPVRVWTLDRPLDAVASAHLAI